MKTDRVFIKDHCYIRDVQGRFPVYFTVQKPIILTSFALHTTHDSICLVIYICSWLNTGVGTLAVYRFKVAEILRKVS